MYRTNLVNYIDSIFDDITTYRPASRSMSPSPTLNIDENDDSYFVSLTTPGIDGNDIDIEIEDYALSISYNHKDESEKSDTKNIRQEYSHYSWERKISLPRNVNPSSIQAESQRGILTITIDKDAEAKPKKISVTVKD